MHLWQLILTWPNPAYRKLMLIIYNKRLILKILVILKSTFADQRQCIWHLMLIRYHWWSYKWVLTIMLFHKMTPPEAKDCCPIGTATTQKRSQSSRFVDEIFANAGEVKRKKKGSQSFNSHKKYSLGCLGLALTNKAIKIQFQQACERYISQTESRWSNS